ncbi:hypothetical protein Ddc_14128 [Ditylenchus destructor]|nr:hypothetical protein Ddc_14128 [Ditylenchus destructor]
MSNSGDAAIAGLALWIWFIIVCFPCMLCSSSGVGVYFFVRQMNKKPNVGYTQGHHVPAVQSSVVVSNTPV